jgi:hypothetical protein
MGNRGLLVVEVGMIGLRVKAEEGKAGLGLAICNERAYDLMTS